MRKHFLKHFPARDCNNILNQRKWDNDVSKMHFESGVRMGNGTFNLMISLLPGRVIKLLEFIGFSGNKEMGMQDLMAGAKMTGLRQVLCTMTLLGYHLIVCYVLSHQEGDLDFCDEMLQQQLSVSNPIKFSRCTDLKSNNFSSTRMAFGFFFSKGD